MKAIVTSLLLLISSGAVAQTAKPALPQTALGESQSAQVNSTVAVSSSQDYSSSRAAIVATNIIPSAPMPAIASSMVRPIPTLNQKPSPDFKPFSSSKVNRALIATEFWTRGLDAYTTHRDLNDPCGCYHESSHFMGMNMTPMLKSGVGAYSYSLGVAAAYWYVSNKVWNATKNHPRHARLLHFLSRGLLVGDSAMEMTADVGNLTITPAVPLNP